MKTKPQKQKPLRNENYTRNTTPINAVTLPTIVMFLIRLCDTSAPGHTAGI